MLTCQIRVPETASHEAKHFTASLPANLVCWQLKKQKTRWEVLLIAKDIFAVPLSYADELFRQIRWTLNPPSELVFSNWKNEFIAQSLSKTFFGEAISPPMLMPRLGGSNALLGPLGIPM